MSFLGLDIGEKKIGLALGSVFAEEYGTLRVEKPAFSFYEEDGFIQALSAIKRIINQEYVEGLVVGLPLKSDGEDSPQTKKVRQFYEKLAKSIDLPIHLENEILTSFAAEEMLREEGLTIKEAKERVDQVSAKLILQQFLEER